MHKLFLAVALTLPIAALAQGACFGPAGCTWAGPSPYPPGSVPGPCFGDYGCSTQEQRMDTRPEGHYAIVWLTLPDGTVHAGIAGPCWEGDCPDLINQAQAEAALRHKHALRALRWRETH